MDLNGGLTEYEKHKAGDRCLERDTDVYAPREGLCRHRCQCKHRESKLWNGPIWERGGEKERLA